MGVSRNWREPRHDLEWQIKFAVHVAATAEGDIRIKELISALRVFPGENGGPPMAVWIDCHSRSWFKHLTPEDIVKLDGMPRDELAVLLTKWVLEAISNGLLSLSNPPLPSSGATNGASFLIAPADQHFQVVTYTYDPTGRHIPPAADGTL